MSDKSNVLKKSVLSAALNVAASIFFRLFTFFANAYILRRVTREVLGVGVRTTLLFDTVLFLSREAFRKACLNKPENGDWRGTINLVWLSVPIGAIASLLLGHIWSNVLELPDHNVDQYLISVKLVSLSSVIILLTEPFYVVGQVYLHIKFRSAVDLFYLCLNTSLQCVVVSLWPDQAVLLYAVVGLLNAILFFVIHVGYFIYVLKSQKEIKKKDEKEPNTDEAIPFESIGEFLPKGTRVDKNRFDLSLTFFTQGIFKQVLTEGEKYMFTWFSLMTLPEQGVYEVIANLGSIPARLFFVKLEESAHLYFSQTIQRGSVKKDGEIEPSRHLNLLLRALLLVGLILCTFGMSYSHLLLHIYGGELLSEGIGPTLLRAQCFYITFLAVNGISECYAFCAMTKEDVSRYNYKMAVMTLIFLFLTYVFVHILGPIGFVVANCCNFSMRIMNNLSLINQRFQGKENHPLRNIWPRKLSLTCLVLAGVICQLSERQAYGPGYKEQVIHLLLGAITFCSIMLVLAVKEDWLRSLVMKVKSKLA
jgi:oligosaccharide translocation protein RFT1